ncbi:SRPBCC domain-containing protein [Parvularcula sp. IMCC14364]|uniref:SRPBCC family protein n=1 Tax=Parvularcula sp. IMCC14364 TaxID=3067902 RepID=UPI002741478E|nr:SRPBCC domain-containing protein [Parvularcula sp. IMCC14364]
MSTDVTFDGQSLIVTRVYAAKIEDVFEAWVETSKIKQWWGCAECIDVQSEVEPKLGGKYNHHMKIETPHGEHEQSGFATLIEYDPPRRLAYTSTDEADEMVITVDFTAVDGGTRVRLVQTNIPDMKVDGDIELRAVIRAGWTAAFGKLAVLFDVSS